MTFCVDKSVLGICETKKNICKSVNMAHIENYIREEYSDDGIEIEGVGAGRIRCRMPLTFKT